MEVGRTDGIYLYLTIRSKLGEGTEFTIFLPFTNEIDAN